MTFATEAIDTILSRKDQTHKALRSLRVLENT